MVTVSELSKIENILRQGEHSGDHGKSCKEYIGKVRRWLASGQSPADVRRKLELLVARYGNVRY
jgi:hypothetical protein